MKWTAIARKDFEDVIRSRMIWGVMGVFLILMVIITLGTSSGDLETGQATEVIHLTVNIGGLLLIPVIALMVGYMAIVGERQSGSLRVFFGLSYSRFDVFVGKLVSRIGVIAVATLVTCIVTAIMMVLLFGEVPVSEFASFSALTILLGMSFTAIAVGISAMTDSRMKAMGGAIGSYIAFIMLWHPLVAGIHYLVEGELVGLDAPNWYHFLLRLNPLQAYLQGTGEIIDQYIQDLFGWPFLVENISMAQAQEQPGLLLVSNRVSGELPFYLTEWFVAVVLLLWVVIPLTVGYWQFERSDLN